MEDLIIEPTKKTPSVDFYASGKLSLAGNACPENAKEFFDPIINWIERLNTKQVNFDLIMEYINTSAANRLLNLLKKLEANSSVKEININWFYEEDDEDNLEAGKLLQQLLTRIKFNYVEYERSAN